MKAKPKTKTPGHGLGGWRNGIAMILNGGGGGRAVQLGRDKSSRLLYIYVCLYQCILGLMEGQVYRSFN